MRGESRWPDPGVKLVDGIAFGYHGDFSTLVYNVPPRYERMRRLYDICDAYLAQLGGSALTLQIVLPTSPAPDGAARAETRKRLATIDPQVRRLVTVAVGDDIKASVVRVIMRGIFAISPRRATRAVTETIPPGVEFLLADRSPNTPHRHEVVKLIDACFTELGVDSTSRALAFGRAPFVSSRPPAV